MRRVFPDLFRQQRERERARFGLGEITNNAFESTTASRTTVDSIEGPDVIETPKYIKKIVQRVQAGLPYDDSFINSTREAIEILVGH